MKIIEQIHGKFIHKHRVRILADHLAELFPKNARVLDVGCGDGLLAYLITQKRPDLNVLGIDFLVRGQTHIPIEVFDGKIIPYANKIFDVVMFVDVLHHMNDPLILLREAVRVARKAIVIKDHITNGLFAGATLRFMDRVGNERHGVLLPFNYWSRMRWLATFKTLGLKTDRWTTKLGIYPWPYSLVFDRSLHFITRLYLT